MARDAGLDDLQDVMQRLFGHAKVPPRVDGEKKKKVSFIEF